NSKKLKNTIDLQARLLVAKAYAHTEKVLNENKEKLKLLAETLLEKETLNYTDVVALLGPPPFGEKKIVDIIDFGPVAADAPPENGAEPRSEKEDDDDEEDEVNGNEPPTSPK